MSTNKEMKIKEFSKGSFIAIEGTKSYPKLKLEVGYIDIRDDIINKNNLEFNAVLMTKKEVIDILGCSEQELDDYVDENIDR